MSVSLWRYTLECDNHSCCGDCDECDYEDDYEEERIEIGEKVWETKKKETQEK